MSQAARSGFVNRRAELSILAEEADRVSQGETRIVHLTGPAGIGKTAIANVFSGENSKLLTVRVAGAEVEAGVHLGLADALHRALASRAGLNASLGTRAGDADPLAYGAALVELLNLVQRPSGVFFLIVDNADWADRASLVALAFALRRLDHHRILAVLVSRDEIPRDEPLARLMDGLSARRMPIGGLNASAIREMASRLSFPVLPLALAGALRDHTGGNPLYLRALFAELSPGWSASTEPLPAPRLFATAVLAALAQCPEPCRQLIQAAAVLGVEARLADAAQMGAVSAPLEAAAAAPASLVGLVDGPRGWTLRFNDPLHRSAVYHDLPPAERVQLHALAAEHVLGRQALWHRASAALHPDPVLAADLRAEAAAETARGQLGLAAEDLAAAAKIHPDVTVRQRLILDAAALRLRARDPTTAAALLATVPDPAGSRWHYVRGYLAAVTGRLQDGHSELKAAWNLVGPRDEDLRGPIAGLLAHVALAGARGDAAAEWAARAVAALPGGHPLLSAARSCLGAALWIAGRNEEAMAGMAALPDNPSTVAVRDASQLCGRGRLRMWADDVTGARADLAQAIRFGEQYAPAVDIMIAAACLAEAHYRLGEWDDAVVCGDLAVSLADDGERLCRSAFSHGIAALVKAARGQWTLAEAHVASARRSAQECGDLLGHGYAANAAVHLAFARQDWRGVAGAGAPLYDLSSRDGIFEPGVMGWRELYGEALIALGSLAEARHDVAEAVKLAADRGRRSALARLSRPVAALALSDGDARQAQLALEEGVEHAGAACGPFDQALVHDALGRLMRRQGERRLAAAHLQAAFDRYSLLAAAPFAQRCAGELNACGLHPIRRIQRRTGLSPREQAVVRLVTRGLTNRQIATELVISVKTVEYHLGSVFSKLSVSNRTQLAASLARQQKD